MKTVSAIMLETRPKYTDKNLLLTEEESQPITVFFFLFLDFFSMFSNILL